MTKSAKRGFLVVALILVIATAFSAVIRRSGRYFYSSPASAAGSMDCCSMMAMDHGAAPTAEKKAAAAAPDGCAMAGMGGGMMEGQEAKSATAFTTDTCPVTGKKLSSRNMPDDAYPLDTCPVKGKKLGSMGEPVIKKYDGHEVRFCCGGCPAKFEQDLQANLKKLDDAIARAKEVKDGNKADSQPVAEMQPAASQGASMTGHQDHAHMH